MMSGKTQGSPLGALIEPPLPPVELRRMVCHDDELFAIGSQRRVFEPVPAELYESVFDFGCGCGRIARQLMCQPQPPRRYLGIDINRPMVQWCREHLTPFRPEFEFQHHDVWNLGLGPDNTRQATQPFPAGDGEFSFLIAHSVFTHLYREQTEFYMKETVRILQPGGMARTTWFFFDKTTFPMMFDHQVCLFINEIDPTNAVIYDWRWFVEATARAGLVLHSIHPPILRGFQWEVYLTKGHSTGAGRFPAADSLQMLAGSGFDPTPYVALVAEKSPPPDSAPAAEPTRSPVEAILAPRPNRERILTVSITGPTRLRYTSQLSEGDFLHHTRQLNWWYHSYYFDNGLYVRGDYDIGSDVAGYGFPESLEGLSVLDIGTGGGWFAHFFEQLGGEVTTVDARGYCDFDVYGRHCYPSIEEEKRQPDRCNADGKPIYFSPVSRAFWIMHDILGSDVRYVNARVYDVCPELFGGQKFDVVFLGAILCHLRDPIGALMAARSVCRGQVIASTPVVLGEPEGETAPRQYLPYTDVDKISWWLPNMACFRHWFLAAGFENVDISRQVALRADTVRHENGRAVNGDQILRVGTAIVPK